MHSVELDGVLLGVPFSGHCDGQGLAGNSKELGLGSFQLSVVQVYLKATLKEQMKSSQGLLRGIKWPFLDLATWIGKDEDNSEFLHQGLTETRDKNAKGNLTAEKAGDEKCVYSFTEEKKKKQRQSKFQTLTFSLCDADILIKPLPFCEKDFSKRQFKVTRRQLRKWQDQFVSLLLILIDWPDFHSTIQGVPYAMRDNQRLLIKAGRGGHSLSRAEGGTGHAGHASTWPQAQRQSDRSECKSHLKTLG